MAPLRIFVLFCLFSPQVLFSQDRTLFRWKLKAGDDLELNEYHKVRARQGARVLNREDKNRILLRAENCNLQGCELTGVFDTYTKFPEVDPAFYKDKTYRSRFFLTNLGEYRVPPEYTMPNLRSLPGFSESEVPEGAQWTMPASESFQFPRSRIEIPVEAKYSFRGIRDWEYGGKRGKAELIEYNYSLMHDSEVVSAGTPYKVYGFAKGKVFFDAQAGVPQYKHVQLVYTFLYPNGIASEMAFDIHGIYSKQRSLTDPDKDRIEEEIKKYLGRPVDPHSRPIGKKESKRNGLDWPEWEEGSPEPPGGNRPSVEVRKSEEGVTLSLDNLLFDTNRSDLKESSREVLAKIAEILKKYPDKEIRIGGHTDDRGSADYNLKLSQDRALSVLQELRDRHALSESRMSYKGYGKTKPIADNASEESRSKNRRVDITIVLD